MEYKAVIFDLFETLITEWEHEKYTKIGVPQMPRRYKSGEEINYAACLFL